MEGKPVTRAVLLVEDNPINQRVAVGLLTKRGHRVVVANNGREALTALDLHDPFDVVLMDVQMPEMDGLETTACIRQQELLTGSHLVIIAITAHAMKGDRKRCLAAGMDAYLSKPIDPKVLFDAIESACRGREPYDARHGGGFDRRLCEYTTDRLEQEHLHTTSSSPTPVTRSPIVRPLRSGLTDAPALLSCRSASCSPRTIQSTSE